VKRFSLIALALLIGQLAAAPISEGETLTSQRFERIGTGSRSAGTYGQYEITLEAGHEYEIATTNAVGGNSTDPYLYLLNTSGTVLAQNDDSGPGLNSLIVYTPSATGTYWIRLRAYSANTYGFCSLTVHHEEPPPPPLPEITPELHAGDVLYNQIFEWRSAMSSRSAGDYGQYMIQMTGGTTYTFETSSAVGAGQDTYLYLLNSSFGVVSSDDDSGPGYLSRITYTPASDATFYVRLRSYSRGALGNCTLTCTSAAAGVGDPLLPDLITWVNNSFLRDAEIETSGSTKRLRLSNAVANRGAGPMRLYGVVNSSTGETQAYQIVYNDNGSQTTYLVGEFVFHGHENHNHWHFDDFSIYELRDPTTNALIASSGKVSFCLLDSVRYTAESIPNTPGSGQFDCENQGISVGWADVYGRHLDGQWIVITGVPDGTYLLRSIADPFDRLHEEPNTNNVGQVTITINGNSVTVQ
jgi:hypothetical protein